MRLLARWMKTSLEAEAACPATFLLWKTFMQRCDHGGILRRQRYP